MWDIILHYDSLDSVIEKLNTLKSKLDTTHSKITTVKTMLENNNSGEAINTLIQTCVTLLENVYSQQDNINVTITVLEDYIDDTKRIIRKDSFCSVVNVNLNNITTNINILSKSLNELEKARVELETAPSWYNDGHCFFDDQDDGDVEAYNYNRGKLENLRDTVTNSKLYINEQLAQLELVENAARNLVNHDQAVAHSLKTINNGLYDMSSSDVVVNAEHGIITYILVNELEQPDGMSGEEFELYKEEYARELESLREEGWDNTALIAYGEYVNSTVYSYKELTLLFSNTKVIGSSVYTEMFANSHMKESEKLELMRNHMLDSSYYFSPDMDYKNSENQNFFEIVNMTVYDSKILEDYDPGNPMFDWIHFDLRFELNRSGAFAPYHGMSDDNAFELMIKNNWSYAGVDANDTVMASRYHSMLPSGYSSHEEFISEMGYDLRYNVKILSSDRRFERIYNTKLRKFVDVDPYMYTSVSDKQNDKYKATAVNMPTYNYGYEEYMEKGHAKLDVSPFDKSNGSMKDQATQMDVSYYKNKLIYKVDFNIAMWSEFLTHFTNGGNLAGFDSAYGRINEINDGFGSTDGMQFK